MPVSDPIADMLTRIRNATLIGKPRISMPRSKVCVGIAEVLKQEGYINDYDTVEDAYQGQLRLELKYGENGEAVVQKLQRESRPGRRRYCKHDEIPRVLEGLGVAILSTSRGVLSDRQARQQRIGGELLCSLW